MDAYGVDVKSAMRRLFESLSEKDRRRYAAVEAMKLGHGGVEYVAGVVGCDPKTVRQGQAELAELPADPAGGRVRKKGVAAERPTGSGDRLGASGSPPRPRPSLARPSRSAVAAVVGSAALAGSRSPSTRSTRRS
jgi:hypothetical protein